MREAARRAKLAALLLAAAGCAPGAYFASPAEYAVYRKTRLGQTLDARLAAAHDYLTRFPRGAFQAEVRAYFDRAEPVYYGAKQGSAAGLMAYLRALPRGPHRDEAAGRLSALRAARANKEAAIEGASSLRAKLDRAGVERRRAREQVLAWLGRFLDASLWKAPLAEAPASFIVPWSLALPSPACAAIEGEGEGREKGEAKRDQGTKEPAGGATPPKGAALRCAKILELPYAVTVDGAIEARQITVEIAVIENAAGRPLRASIGGPELFLRLEETFSVRAIEPLDHARALSARARAAALIEDAFGRAVSRDPVCKRPAAAPVLADLACGAIQITARAAEAPGEDDMITVAPM